MKKNKSTKRNEDLKNILTIISTVALLLLIVGLVTTLTFGILNKINPDILKPCEHLNYYTENSYASPLYHGNVKICRDCGARTNEYVAAHSFCLENLGNIESVDDLYSASLVGNVGDKCDDCGYVVTAQDISVCNCVNSTSRCEFVDFTIFTHFRVYICDSCDYRTADPTQLEHDFERTENEDHLKIDKCRYCYSELTIVSE